MLKLFHVYLPINFRGNFITDCERKVKLTTYQKIIIKHFTFYTNGLTCGPKCYVNSSVKSDNLLIICTLFTLRVRST